jgi:Phage integrase family.
MARPRATHKHWPKYVHVRGGSFWYEPPGVKGERMKDKHGESIRLEDESGMYQWLANKLRDIPSGPVQTMNDLFDKYQKEIVPTLQPRTQRDYRKHITKLRETFGHMAPNDVLPKDVGRFLDVPKGKIHRNRMVATLSAVCSKAVGKWWLMDRNPCTKVERNESSPRDRNVTDAEFAAVYKIANPKVQVAMDLALLTGQRQGDILRMRWADITEEGWTMRQGKTGKRLLIGMSPAFKEVLDRAKGFVPHLPREYVLRRRNGKRYTEDGFRAMWQRTMRQACGIKNKDGTWKVPPVISQRFTFHDLRAKSVTDSASINDAFERAGHTSVAMTRRVYDRGVRKVKPLK